MELRWYSNVDVLAAEVSGRCLEGRPSSDGPGRNAGASSNSAERRADRSEES